MQNTVCANGAIIGKQKRIGSRYKKNPVGADSLAGEAKGLTVSHQANELCSIKSSYRIAVARCLFINPNPIIRVQALVFSYEASLGQVHRNCKEVMGSVLWRKAPTATSGRTWTTFTSTPS